jgi:hypothetical protein
VHLPTGERDEALREHPARVFGAAEDLESVPRHHVGDLHALDGSLLEHMHRARRAKTDDVRQAHLGVLDLPIAGFTA